MNNKVKIYAILWDIFIGHSCECMNQKCIRFCCILNPYCTHQAWCMKAEKSLSKDREAKKKQTGRIAENSTHGVPFL